MKRRAKRIVLEFSQAKLAELQRVRETIDREEKAELKSKARARRKQR